MKTSAVRIRVKKYWKISVGLLACVIVGLLTLAAYRALSASSKQIHPSPYSALNFDTAAATKRLSAALQLKTVSYSNADQIDYRAFTDFHALVQREFPLVHANLRREFFLNYSLLYEWPGTDPKCQPVLMMSHLDVVPVEDEQDGTWTQPPFSGTVADGYIYGRGTLDIKSGVMALMESAEALLASGFKPQCTLYFAFGHDEEIGGSGNKAIAHAMAERGVRFSTVFDEGGVITSYVVAGVNAPTALVGIAEKGYATLELSVEQEGGHSSMPPPQTAIAILAENINKLSSTLFPMQLNGATAEMLATLAPETNGPMRFVLSNRWLFQPLLVKEMSKSPGGRASIQTTVAVTEIAGGIKDNVLPKSAKAKINFRILPGESVAGVLAKVKEKLADDARVHTTLLDHWEPTKISSTDSPSYRQLQDAIMQTFPDALVVPNLCMAATDSRHYEALTDRIFRFMPSRLASDELKMIHGTNERLAVENYAEYIRFFIQLIRNTTGSHV